MLKWITVLIILIFFVPFVTGTAIIEWSVDNATWQNVTDVDEGTGIAYQANLEEGTLYYFRSRNDTTDFVYFTATTETSGERPMSSVSITFFVMFVTILFFYLPYKIESFSKKEYLNYVIKGSMITLGLFLLSLVGAMMATLANSFNLGVTREIFRFMWIIQWSAYLTMVIVVLGFGYKALQLWKVYKYNQRMRTDEPEYN